MTAVFENHIVTAVKNHSKKEKICDGGPIEFNGGFQGNRYENVS